MDTDAKSKGWVVLDIPIPPSVNDFTSRLGNRSASVIRWCKQADLHYVMAKRDLRKIVGLFEADVTLSRAHCGSTSDLDNRIKPLFDWLQKRVGLVENDRFCEKLTIQWGRAPLGCIVKLREWRSSS